MTALVVSSTFLKFSWGISVWASRRDSSHFFQKRCSSSHLFPMASSSDSFVEIVSRSAPTLPLFVHNELLSIEQPVDIPGSRIPHPRDPFGELTDPVLGLADLLAVG